MNNNISSSFKSLTIKQTSGLKRNTVDKFYTKENIVNLCITNIINNLHIDKNDIIIEPSAGSGAFISKILTLTNTYHFYDIEPDNNLITKQDFLELDYKNLISLNKKIHIIGNPPFGRQATTAIKFIKRCCEFSNSISFILPKSFKKDSMKKHFNSYFHLIFEIDLPENSFLLNNKEYNAPCVFQIWQKQDIERLKIIKLEPVNFIFTGKNKNPDISFRRVGVNAGNISTSSIDKSEQSHYFIKFLNNKNLNENLQILKNVNFQHNNTVGPKSISKQELISEFNKIL